MCNNTSVVLKYVFIIRKKTEYNIKKFTIVIC